MSGQILAKWNGRALIKQYPHSRNFQRTGRVLEHEARLVERHTRKPPHELGKLHAILEVLEQRSDRNSCAAEYPSASDALGVALDCRA